MIYNFPKFRPKISVSNTGTYGWEKFFVPLLKRFTLNDHTIKDPLNLQMASYNRTLVYLWHHQILILF